MYTVTYFLRFYEKVHTGTYFLYTFERKSVVTNLNERIQLKPGVTASRFLTISQAGIFHNILRQSMATH